MQNCAALQKLVVRGAFGPEAAHALAAILAAYGLGLVPTLAARSLVAAFHGRGDTRSPLRLLTAVTADNFALKVVLALGAIGLTLGTSTGIGLYAELLFRTGRTKGYFCRPLLRFAFFTMIIAAAHGAATLLALIRNKQAIFAPAVALVGQRPPGPDQLPERAARALRHQAAHVSALEAL